jgi:hypothetical protein
MQESRYGYTNITSEYLIYPFSSPIGYNFNYTGTYSKYSIIDKFYVNSLVKPVKRLYYGGAEWCDSDPIALTFSLTNMAYTFADEILFKTASMPNLSVSVAHPTYDRIDAIVVNEDGDIKIKEGTPAPIPKKPVLEEDEVLIQYALIKKSVDKVGTHEKVYENNSQWSTSAYQISGTVNPSDVNFNSNNGQFNSTYCIAANTDYRTGLDFKKSVGTIKRSDYASLSMRVRFNNELDHNRFLSAQIYGTSSNYLGTASSNTINLMAYGLEPNIIGEWQHVVVPTIKFGNKVETVKGLKIRMIGGASASKTSWDLDWVLFQTGVDYDEYMDPSNCGPCNGSTTTTVSGGGGGGTPLTIKDYLTGEEFTDISTIVFRGNTVVVNHAQGLTATGVTVTGQTPEVVVWIPAPNYVAAFNPSIDASGLDRYVSLPDSNSYLATSSPGTFGVGSDWDVLANLNANGTSVGTTRKTKYSGNLTSLTSFNPFTNSAFSCSSQTTTIKFEVFKEDETTAIRTITKTLNTTTHNQTYATDDASLAGASLTLGAFSNDQDKFKLASLTATLNCVTLFPNGGRFKCRITHNNGLDGTIVKNTMSFLYDNDALPSSITVPTVIFDEKVAVTKMFSGIAYYKEGSSFAMTASNINMLNDITFPTTKQIDFVPNNLSMSNDGTTNFLNGHSAGTKSVGAAITGWGINWNKSGLTFSRTGLINLIMNNNGPGSPVTSFTQIGDIDYTPGFSPHTTNNLNTSKVSSVTVRLFDYLSPDVVQTSPTKKTLIDTDTAGVATAVSNPVDSENNRLSFTGVRGGPGNSPFDSTILLNSGVNTTELQYLFGRVIYPQHNFTDYMPYFNFTRSCDYTSLAGISTSFDMFTTALNIPGDTVACPLNDYRWYVTQYAKASGETSTTGYFTIESNILETDFHCIKGVSSDVGTGNAVILIGVDGSGGDSAPTKYIFLTGNTAVYGGRTQGSLNFINGNSRLSFGLGYVSAPISKFWLFVGFKNNSRGKELYLSDVQFTGF